MTNKEKFREVYERKLRDAINRDKSGHYQYYDGPNDPQIPIVCDIMTDAFAIGTANTDSPAAKAACRELGIKFGKRALIEHLNK